MAGQQDRAFDDLRNTLNEYARIFRDRWRLALIGLAVAGSVAFWFSQYLPREYRAATIFERRDDAVLRNLIHANSPYSFDNLKSSIGLDITGSRALAQAALRVELLAAEFVPATGALDETSLRELDGVVGRYALKPSLKMLHSSSNLDTIELRCDANDPEIARKFVIAMRENYIADSRRRISDILTNTKAFFEAETERFRQRADAITGQLKVRFDEFPGVDPTDLSSAGNRMETLRMERDRLYDRKADLEGQIEAFDNVLSAVPDAVVDEATASQPAALRATGSRSAMVDQTMQSAIRNVGAKVSELINERQMTLEHPAVKRLLKQLEMMHALRDEVLRAARNQEPLPDGAVESVAPVGDAYREWNRQRFRVELELVRFRKSLVAVQARFDVAEARMQKFKVLYDKMLERGDEIERLQEQVAQHAATAGVWKQHLSQLTRVLAAEAGQRGTRFSLIEAPKRVTRAVTPRVTSIFSVCLGLGLAAAALLVALAELLDRSFRSAGQVTRVLGIPVLECVGAITTPRERRRRLLSRLAWAPTLAVLSVTLLGTASLAYTSLERPDVHRRTIAKLDGLLTTFGAPTTSLSDDQER